MQDFSVGRKVSLIGPNDKGIKILNGMYCIEGYGRFHYQESIQFCRQARGSLYELVDHIDVATECKYIEDQKAAGLIGDIKTTIRTLNGYIKYLKDRKDTA